MPGSFVQQKQGSAASSGATTISGSITTTAGNALALIVTYTGATTTVTPGTNLGTFVEDVSLQHAAGGGIGMHVFTCDSCIGTTGQLTTTFGAARTNRGHWIIEMAGIDHYIAGNFPAYATAPGTGADAISSGNYNIINPPNYMLGFAWDQSGGGVIPAVGAGAASNGWISQGTGWLFADATGNARLMDNRFLSSGNQAATFTDATGGGANTYAALILAFAESITTQILLSQNMY